MLNQIDESSQLSKIPICRFAYPNFPQLISDNVLSQVLDCERTKYDLIQTPTNWEWLNNQLTSHNESLANIKVGVLGLGTLGKQIAKTFKVSSSTYV